MLAGRKVPDEKDVFGPGKFFGILSAANQEALLWQLAGRLDEKRIERRLPVLSISAQIRKIRLIIFDRGHRAVDVGIDAAIKGGRSARSQFPVQGFQSGPAR